MHNKSVFFTLWVLICLPLGLQATVVDKMYEVSLPVINQEKDIRRAAFEQAFIEVVVRVSGSSQAPVRLDLDIKRASRYVQQFRYLALEQPADQKTPAPAKPTDLAQPKHTLWVQFDEGSIKKLLRENALPIWGKQRPNVLILVAVRDGRNRYILKQQDSSVIKDAVALETQRRGLPVIWPSMDKLDQKNVSFADVWGAFREPVIRASERYGVDAVIVGRMNWMRGSWQVNWNLFMDKKATSWQLKALDLKLLMASGIDVTTDQISSRFAVLEDLGNEGQLVVQISGIKQTSSYARAAQYLRSLAPVKNVYAMNVQDENVSFHVDMTGGKRDLQRIIALGRTLVPDNSPVLVEEKPKTEGTNAVQPLSQVSANVLRYRLNP